MSIGRILQACFWIFSLSILRLHAQSISVTGIVTDTAGNPLSQASVRVSANAGVYQTNAEGKFQLSLPRNDRDSCQISVSYLGKQPYIQTLPLNHGHIYLPKIILQDLSLKLDEIAVQAQTGTGSTNSSLVINREMIERYPALSVNDLLNQLPNRSITAPSLQSVQNVTLRGAFEPAADGARNPYELNNAFGVAIIMDDIAISNNANMQSQNPGIRGLARAALTVRDDRYGLHGRDNTGNAFYTGDNTFGGVDLRQIPAENIERLEVIAGVPSVRYGDLTDGAIILERQAGPSPAYLRMQLRNNATSYSYSQGLRLSPKLGSLNLTLNYVNSFADNRDKIKQYNRINTSAIWTSFFDKERKWKQTLSATYGKHLDGLKRDPDDPTVPRVSFNNWNLQASSRTSYQADGPFFKRFSFNFGYSTAHQETYSEREANTAFVLYTDAVQTGIVEGTYDSGIYTAVDHYDGRPLNLTARLETNAQWQTGKLTHQLTVGSTFDLNENNGKGRLADPSKPVQNLGSFGDRYYDFQLAVPQKTWGFYAEDAFVAQLAGRPLNVQAGLRTDLENGQASYSPRTNLRYSFNRSWDVGFAYGLAYKAPGLAQRYPGPIFTEIILLNAFNGKASESTSRIYVDRYDPDPSQLHASRSQTFELSTHWNKKGYRLSFNAFFKTNSNGINTSSLTKIITLPQYTASPVAGSKPIVTESGTRNVSINNNIFNNSLTMRNAGVELMFNTPRFAPISTSFILSGGFYRSFYFADVTEQESVNPDGANPDDAVIGYYNPSERITYSSNGRIGSVTHLPKLRLVIELTADFRIYNRTVLQDLDERAKPIAYLTRGSEYIQIDTYDPQNPIHKQLYDAHYRTADTYSQQASLYANFHLSVAKEIGKRLRLAFNVYNFLDYQPRYYLPTVNSYRIETPNSPPNFGAEVAFKL